MLEREKIVELTEEYGGGWGINHTRRLLHIIPTLADGKQYDEEVVWLAAHLHDWGGYTKWAVPGVDHAIRSVEVARDFLTENGYPEDLIERVLECIQYHHGGNPDRSLESILLTDADAMDLLGTIGMLRIFAMVPRDLKGGYNAARMWREKEAAAICLEKTKELAAKRMQESDEIIRVLEEESFGLL